MRRIVAPGIILVTPDASSRQINLYMPRRSQTKSLMSKRKVRHGSIIAIGLVVLSRFHRRYGDADSIGE